MTKRWPCGTVGTATTIVRGRLYHYDLGATVDWAAPECNGNFLPLEEHDGVWSGLWILPGPKGWSSIWGESRGAPHLHAASRLTDGTARFTWRLTNSEGAR